MPNKHKDDSEWRKYGTSVVFEGVGLPELTPATQAFYTWYAKTKKSTVAQTMIKVCEDFAKSTLEQLSREEAVDLLSRLDSLSRVNGELKARLGKFLGPKAERTKIEAELDKIDRAFTLKQRA